MGQVFLLCDMASISLQWRHNGCDGISNHQPHDCLLNRLFSCKSKKTSKLCVTGLCEGNSPVTSEYPAQMASNAENASIWCVIVLCSVCWTIWNSHKSCKAIVLCPSIIFLKSFHSLLMEYSLYCIVNPSIVFCVHVKMHWISNRDVGFLILQDYASHVPKHLLIEADGRIYASGKLIIIGSDNGLSPTRPQAIIWTTAGILLIGPSGTNFSEIFIGIQTFSVKKMHLKMSYARSCSFCLGLNMLNFCIFILNILQFCCCLIYWR